MKNKMRSKKKMWIVLGVMALVVLSVVVFFNVPYSKLEADFNHSSKLLMNDVEGSKDVFTEKELEGLPTPVKKYFNYCGLIGKKKMIYMKASFKDVTFKTGKDKPTLKIDYTQYNFVNKPDRIAFIDSALYGIPFQGFDSYIDGTGGMKGVIAKCFTLIDQRGEDMDKASLVTYLAECFIVPTVVLQERIIWESMDETHAKATITHDGISVSGVFAFSDDGEMISFTTNDRVATEMNGTTKQVSWTVVCSDYKDSNGIKLPTVLKAIWHYEDGDQVYFDGNQVQIEYYYQ